MSLMIYNNNESTEFPEREFEEHKKYVRIAAGSRATVLLIGDSLIKGLTRYHSVWSKYFKPLGALNFGIGGDQVRDVLWRIENGGMPLRNLQVIVLHCGTCDIDDHSPTEIYDDIVKVVQSMKEKKRYKLNIIIAGLLPRDQEVSERWDAIKLVNQKLRKWCQSGSIKNVHFLNPENDWKKSDGYLNEKFYFTDFLHLIEAGNEKFAKSIYEAIVKVRQGKTIDSGIEICSDENIFDFQDDGASNGPPKRQKLEEKTTDKNVKQQKGSRSEEFDKYDADIEGKLMLKMPDDLYWFWEFCKDISSSSPKDAFKESLGLVLTGPFDILNGSFEDADDSKLDSIHLHSRFYYDPPEFMTLVKEDTFTEGFHIGYFRDDPNNMPSFLASNSSNDGYEFTICGETIFAAVNISINDKLRTIKDKMRIKEVKELQTKLQSFAKEKRYRLDPVTASIKARNKNMVTKSFHKLGIVVPVVNDVGYRELPYTDSQLKKLLKEIADTRNESAKEKAFEDIQEVITLIQFANDECDYGMGLELGIDLFCFGNEMLHGPIMSLLPLAYQLLGKQLYAEIIEKHINKRSLESLDLCKVPRKNNAASNWH